MELVTNIIYLYKEDNTLIPLIMAALSLAQKKQQQNQADNQRLAQSIQSPQIGQNANALLGTNFGQQQAPIQFGGFETEEEKRKKMLGM